ncbi:MAG: hypothetical protein NC218_07270 [Acetobacter sp.]|nr:hypothetical protein [Acetobacter sp.]
MTKKITKTMRNLDAIALLEGKAAPNGSTVEEVIAHLRHENELLAKKNSGDSKKPTKAQQENEGYKAQILEFLLTQTEGVTATQVMNGVGLSSNQKAAALLRAMVEAGTVTKAVEKGKALFSAAADEGEGA